MQSSLLTKFIIIGLAFFLGGCVTHVKSEPKEPMKQQVTVTVSGPELPISSKTPITWFSDVVALMDKEVPQTPADPFLPKWFKPIIESHFTRKGFNMSSSAEPTRYQLAAVVTVGEGSYSKNAQDLFSLYPSLMGESEDHPKGTLLMALVDTRTHQAVWRGAVQVFTDNNNASQAQVEQRVNGLLEGLLRKLKPNDL